jgi:dihydrofolate reductase
MQSRRFRLNDQAEEGCMAKLIYSMLTSLDGYTEDEHGQFGWGAPEDASAHSYINELGSSFGTYLYGRRMYETMVFWETAHTLPDQPPFVLDYARQWQAAEKIVFSGTSQSRAAREPELCAPSIRTRSGGSRPTPSAT